VVVIVGGGVIGLSCAWRLAGAGLPVTLVDAAPGSGASWVAGGMLAPVTEAWPGEERLLEQGCASLARWPAFAAALAAAAQDAAALDAADALDAEALAADAPAADAPAADALDADALDADARGAAGLRTEGTVVAAVDAADRAELDALAAHLAGLGREVQALTGRELRRLEPALGPAVRAGLVVPGDLAVDNRRLLGMLLDVLHARQPLVRFVGQHAVAARPGRATLADGSTVDGDVVVLAAGAWSAALHPALRGRLRPVKGEIVRLRARATALPPPTRTVRAVVGGRPVYLVPRDGGRLVLGATQYEAGFDTDVTVAGVRDLLHDAELVVPGIAEYAIEEIAAGLRPATADNLPLVGELEPGVLAATGHGRNGILLAPLTADAVLAMVRGEPPPAGLGPSSGLGGRPSPGSGGTLDVEEVRDESVAQRR
jgi:glycine oxidase